MSTLRRWMSEGCASASNDKTPADWSRQVAGVTAVVLLVAAAVYGFYVVFSRSLSIDEGYLMITVQSFLQGEALYDSVFTQYGAFYYFYKWVVHRVLFVPLTHDATRFLCVVHWLTAATMLAFAGRAITRSNAAGLFVFMQAVVHLSPLANEPGHPQELVAMLMAAAMLVASRDRPALTILTVVGAVLLLVKINVGIFYCAALWMTMLWHTAGRFSRGGWAWLVIAGSTVLPFVLMRRHVMYDAYRNYAALGGAALLASLLTAKETAPKSDFGLGQYVRMAGAFLVASLLLVGLAAGTGTSLTGIVDGLFLTPLKTPEVGILPFRFRDYALLSAAFSVSVAVWVWFGSHHPRLGLILNTLRIALGVTGAVILVGNGQALLKYVLPWSWLVLFPAARIGMFGRVLLAIMTGFQSLQAYPIAGTQMALASVLLVLLSTVCIFDAISALRLPEIVRARTSGWPTGRRSLVQSAVALGAIYLFANVWCNLPEGRRYYGSLPELELPGSRYVRTDAETTQRYQALAKYLEANSDTFLTCPGMNSFYFWTAKPPPTHLNPTALGMLTAAQEARVFAALRASKRPLVVVLDEIVEASGRDDAAPAGMLMKAVKEEYVEVHRIPPFRIYALNKR